MGGAQLANALGDALLSEVDEGQLHGEALGAHLAREAEATRMLRLVVRLAQVLERPEGDLDPQWAETGAPTPYTPAQESELLRPRRAPRGQGHEPAVHQDWCACISNTPSSQCLGAHLARGAEAARMLRLAVRLAHAVEHPEGDLDRQWAGTGAPACKNARIPAPAHLPAVQRNAPPEGVLCTRGLPRQVPGTTGGRESCLCVHAAPVGKRSGGVCPRRRPLPAEAVPGLRVPPDRRGRRARPRLGPRRRGARQAGRRAAGEGASWQALPGFLTSPLSLFWLLRTLPGFYAEALAKLDAGLPERARFCRPWQGF